MAKTANYSPLIYKKQPMQPIEPDAEGVIRFRHPFQKPR